MKKGLVFFLCLALFTPQGPLIDQGKVVVVYDGDTIKVRSAQGVERRVRLIGIDTPEIGSDSTDEELEALLAKRFAFHHLYRRNVKLSYDKEREDKYGRLLAYVWTDSVLFNELILREGFARAYLKFPFKMEEKFVQAQKRAQERGRGFWYEGAYPVIAIPQVGQHIGKLSRVRFVCSRMRKSGSMLFLLAEDSRFAAIIQEERRYLFGDIRGLEGRTIQVFGFLEDYRGQPQIMLFFPSQIEVVDPGDD